MKFGRYMKPLLSKEGRGRFCYFANTHPTSPCKGRISYLHPFFLCGFFFFHPIVNPPCPSPAKGSEAWEVHGALLSKEGHGEVLVT